MLVMLSTLITLGLAQQTLLGPHTALSSPFDENLAQKVNESLLYYHVPGLSISIVQGSEIYAKGYGLASLPDTPATPETLWYGASTTKAFTAAAASLLVDNGTLRWNTPLCEVIRDEFVLSDDYATTHVTLEDALSHRTGLPRHDLIIAKANVTLSDIVQHLRYLPFTAALRTRLQYNNLMYETVGYVIERLTNKPLGDFLHQYIWKPLNMTGTYLSLQDAQDSSLDLSRGYFWNNETQSYVQVPHTPTTIGGAAGSIISNVVDYAMWLRAMIHHAAPISAAGHAALMTPRTIIGQYDLGLKPEMMTGDPVYSLGWMKFVYRGQQIISHSGSLIGYGSLALYLPDREWGVTIMANTMGSSNYAALTLVYHLIDDMLEVPLEERLDWFQIYANDTANAERLLVTARNVLYPSTPSPPLPHALPLEAYAGYYHHPAYPSFNLDIVNGHPQLIIDNEIIAAQVDLEHVSGEHWLAVMMVLFTGQVVTKSRAEFRLNVEGRVTEFGVEFDGEMAALGEKIWFSRDP